MKLISQIIEALDKNDLDSVNSISEYYNHLIEIDTNFQLNYLYDYHRIFFKLYTLESGRWNFFDYGYLQLIKNTHWSATFFGYKSKITIFNLGNISLRMERHNKSNCHLLIRGDGINYMLRTPYESVINGIFDMIAKN